MPRRLHRHRVIGIGLIALAGSVLAACSSSNPGGPDEGTGTDPAGAQSRIAHITITAAHGCTPDHTTFPAGGITFDVVNRDATAVSEVELQSGDRIVGERENLPPGLSGSFVVRVDAGKYTLYCPGAKVENITLTVTGKAADTTAESTKTLLAQGTKEWGQYVNAQVGYLVQTVKTLDTTLHGTKLPAAQAAYMKARPYYEKIEPVAESFVLPGGNNLDTDIDIRHNPLDTGSDTVPFKQWRGFHRIEYGLFAQQSLAGLGAFGDQLLADVTKLQTLTKDLTYKPTELISGAQDLLNEVASSKITGEEEYYSHIDILDFEANDEGAEQAFAVLKPALVKLDAGTTASVSSAFAALDALVNRYRTGGNPSGFVLYGQLTTADKKKLAAAVANVQEPLAQLAKTVANS